MKARRRTWPTLTGAVASGLKTARYCGRFRSQDDLLVRLLLLVELALQYIRIVSRLRLKQRIRRRDIVGHDLYEALVGIVAVMRAHDAMGRVDSALRPPVPVDLAF